MNAITPIAAALAVPLLLVSAQADPTICYKIDQSWRCNDGCTGGLYFPGEAGCPADATFCSQQDADHGEEYEFTSSTCG
jgi:hypothetical protein